MNPHIWLQEGSIAAWKYTLAFFAVLTFKVMNFFGFG